MMLVTALNTS